MLLPVQSVGVMGDGRTYEDVIAVRADSDDRFHDGRLVSAARTKSCSGFRRRVINSVRGVNRVVYDVSSKPPSTIEWE